MNKKRNVVVDYDKKYKYITIFAITLYFLIKITKMMDNEDNTTRFNYGLMTYSINKIFIWWCSNDKDKDNHPNMMDY